MTAVSTTCCDAGTSGAQRRERLCQQYTRPSRHPPPASSLRTAVSSRTARWPWLRTWSGQKSSCVQVGGPSAATLQHQRPSPARGLGLPAARAARGTRISQWQHRVLADGSLAIRSVQPWPGGVFVCLATGPRLPHNPDARVQRERGLSPPGAQCFQHRLHHAAGRCAVGLTLRAPLPVRPLPRLPPLPASAPAALLPPLPPLAPAPSPLRELSTVLGAQYHATRRTQPQSQCPQTVVFLEPGRRGLSSAVCSWR